MAYTFGSGTVGFGAHTGWELQGSTVTKNKSLARALNNVGTEVAINAFNEIEEVSSTYKCSSNTNTIPPSIGAEVNGYVLTGIEVTPSPDDYATMVLTGHKHNAGAATAPAKTAAHGFTLGQAFGIPTAPLTGMNTANSAADWTAFSIKIGVEHAEATGSSGDSVAHENYDANIVVTASALSAITEPTGYTVTAQTAPESGNTSFQAYSVTCQKKLTLA